MQLEHLHKVIQAATIANTANTIYTFYESTIVANAPALSLVALDGTDNNTGAKAAVGQIGIKDKPMAYGPDLRLYHRNI